MTIKQAALAFSTAILLAGPAPAHEGHHHDMGAVGRPGDAAQATRSIAITMNDAMRFAPAAVTVRKGETIRFILRNDGQVRHEFVLGEKQALKAHYEMMKQMPGMQHTAPNMVSLDPGQSGEVVWQFTRPGQVEFACLQPGHFDAGMVGAVTVTTDAAAPR